MTVLLYCLSVICLVLLCGVDVVGSKQTADSQQKSTKSADFGDFILREDGDTVFMKDSRQNEDISSDICMVLCI